MTQNEYEFNMKKEIHYEKTKARRNRIRNLHPTTSTSDRKHMRLSEKAKEAKEVQTQQTSLTLTRNPPAKIWLGGFLHV